MTFFHGYYKQYQYLPRAITCAENDLVVMVCLLFGTAHAALGADDDLKYLVGRLRTAFPGVRIMLRGDSGFGVPHMYEACEGIEIDYTIGISMNSTLQKQSDPLMQHCVEQFEASGDPQRKFCTFWYRALFVAGAAMDRHQVRGERSRHESSRGGDQSAGRVRVASRGVRRLF